MEDNITLHELRNRINTLEYTIKNVCENFMGCLIYESDEGYCVCGCGNLPIANLLFRVHKTNGVRVYGVKVFPTRSCHLEIMACDNRGSVIKYEIYQAVQSWLNSIPRSMERQQERVETIKRELLDRTLPSLDEEI